MKDKTKSEVRQAAWEVASRLKAYVEPLLRELDEAVDKRLVKTFEKTLQAIITFRHSSHGLLLSELGDTSPTERRHQPARNG